MSAHNISHNHSKEDQLICLLTFIQSVSAVGFLSINVPDFGRSLLAARKIISIQDLPSEGSQKSVIMDGHIHSEKASELLKNGEIRFENVWFRYPNSDPDMWVLEDFSLTIEPNQSLGLVGESGCGKSTIAALLFRFYDPQKGKITIGNIPLKDF